MYQLSHLLSEQRSLLNSLSSTSVLGEETPVVIESDLKKDISEEQEEDNRRYQLASIFENVEGCGVRF